MRTSSRSEEGDEEVEGRRGEERRGRQQGGQRTGEGTEGVEWTEVASPPLPSLFPASFDCSDGQTSTATAPPPILAMLRCTPGPSMCCACVDALCPPP